MNTTAAKNKHYSLLAFFCISHAALVTSLVIYGVSHSDSFAANIHLLLVLLGAWPFWALVLWKFGWRPMAIVLTMILGLLILSPVLFLFLVGWAMEHGGSLG
jgi:hypothetical protein